LEISSADPTRIAPAMHKANEGDTHVIECLSRGVTQWSLEDKELPANAKSDRSRLTITGITIENLGIYECIGYYASGETFLARSTLLVRGK